MALERSAPRVTLGVATYNRDTYLHSAVASCLAQDYPSLEVLVVIDGSTNPGIDDVLARFAGDQRLRVVRHERNLGIAAAYNTFVSQGRGELIAMLGDDDIAFPDRISRQVAVFDRHPETGIVHGNAVIIDAAGKRTGVWESADFPPGALVQCFYRRHNYLVDPSRMVHRRVYEQVGGYDARFPVAQDFEFWLRAARHFRFRHVAGEPLIALRRHGDNGSDESNRAAETREVSIALEEALERYSLRELVPELDWSVLHPADAERQALARLADQVAARGVPTPDLARRLRARAAASPAPAVASTAPATPRRKLLMTMYGFNDSGGGTILPRLVSKELVRRGWDVTVFYASTSPLAGAGPYATSDTVVDGVRLIGVHNRPHGLFDLGHPERELDDPAVRLAFRRVLAQVAPDVVHFHNLHNLGASLIDEAFAHGLPTHFTTHNYWLICPRAYMLDGSGAMCPGPGDGSRCASCVASHDVSGHQRRLREIQARVARGVGVVHAISHSVRRTLMAAGYPGERIDVVRQAMPHEREIWEQVGARRARGRRGEELTVAFVGSALPHKGPQLLVEAAQRTQARIRVLVAGEVPKAFADRLRRLDERGVVDLCGAFSPSELPRLLADADAAALPSTWWDCANLAAQECRAAGLPLLVPRLGGLQETVRDGVDGLTFAGLDADDLARQLDRLALEPGLLESLQAGIEPPASFDAYVDELEAYYGGERPAAVREAAGEPSVRWIGDFGLPTSLSIINDRVTERLGVRVGRVARDGTSAGEPLGASAEVEVRHQWPPDFSPASAGRLAVIQPWEFGSIPRDWRDQITANVDELWVPSEYVRGMYVDAGIDPERVAVIANGVDLDVFTPDGPRAERPEAATRFLFVGGLIGRKGPDLLYDAYTRAFAGRDDVTLVIKDFGAGDIYRDGQREAIYGHARSGALPRIEVIDDELTSHELAALYRACDVLVAPYRGEGFAMPVLEAMACGLPVIATQGGPSDEFCPEAAGWRLSARRSVLATRRIDAFETVGHPWVLEPDVEHLVALMRHAAATPPAQRRERGRAGRQAAAALSWDEVARRYEHQIRTLAARPRPGPEPFELTEDVDVRILATPAWRGEDRLPELLAAWSAATTPDTSACLYLLADPTGDGDPTELEARVIAAAAAGGADLDACADINVLMQPLQAGLDASLHAAVDAYVPLHDGCAGHRAMAAAAGSRILAADSLDGLAAYANA